MEWHDETDAPHSYGENCPTCKDTFKNGLCAFVQVVDRRSSSDAKHEPEKPLEIEASHGRYECPGCKKVHTYRLPLAQDKARAIVLEHQHCRQGKRRGAKQRLTVGRFGTAKSLAQK